MRRVARPPASPGDAIGLGKEAFGAGRGGSPERHPVTQGEEVENAAPDKPDAQRSTPDAPPMSTAALSRSLGLGRRGLPSAGRLRSLAEVADYLDVSIRTVRRLIARGELRAHRVGRSLRIQDAELAVYVAASVEQ